MVSIPTNSAIAGIAQTASMRRHTPSRCPHTLPITALTAKAAKAPTAIITSLRPASEPRVS